MQPQIILSSQDKRARRPPITSAPQPVCQGCKKQLSRYSCPQCNFHYCCLACYRSAQHSSCSEAFDRRSLLQDIAAARDKTGDEKRAMLEMLKKFEAESLQQDEDGGEEDDSERGALEHKLEGVNLDSLSPEDLLALLSPAQQAAFNATLQDPAKVTALVSAEFEGETPWWDVDEQPEFELDSLETPLPSRPPLVDSLLLPALKVGSDGQLIADAKLLYNIVAVLFAYAYTLRTFSLTSFASLPLDSTERSTVAEMMAQLVPFLVEKSSVILENVDSAVEHVVARETSENITSELLALLLRDVDQLLRPISITAGTASSSVRSPLLDHFAVAPLTALSDVRTLFANRPPSSTSAASPLISRRNHAAEKAGSAFTAASQKVAFYISFLSHPNSPVTPQLLARTASVLNRDAGKRQAAAQATKEAVRMRAEQRKARESLKVGVQPKILEIA